MNLLTIEKDIITRLENQLTTDTQVRSFPQDPARFFRALRQNGAILVRYEASDYGPLITNKNETRVQRRTARWIFEIVYRNPVGHNATSGTAGVYKLMQEVRQALTGYTPGTASSVPITDSTVMYPVRDNFEDHVNDLWFYSMTFEHTLEETPNR